MFSKSRSTYIVLLCGCRSWPTAGLQEGLGPYSPNMVCGGFVVICPLSTPGSSSHFAGHIGLFSNSFPSPCSPRPHRGSPLVAPYIHPHWIPGVCAWQISVMVNHSLLCHFGCMDIQGRCCLVSVSSHCHKMISRSSLHLLVDCGSVVLTGFAVYCTIRCVYPTRNVRLSR